MNRILTTLLIVATLGVFAYARFARAEQRVEPQPQEVKSTSGKVEVATFAAGCFWHVQDSFDHVKGVLKTTAGYTGGTLKNPTYEQVCTHATGHAESVEVTYDPAVITYQQLVEKFWSIHNPTQVNRQGPDVGENYRSAIFYHTPEQKTIAEASKQKMNVEKYNGAIATRIAEAHEFYPAEEYHQHYLKKNGGVCNPF